MGTKEIENLIKEIIERTAIRVNKIDITDEKDSNTWFSVEVSEPHFFITNEGEALYALNHLVRRIIETRNPLKDKVSTETDLSKRILIDINEFQKRRVENIRAVAHMMSERARYFKSNIEVDPMSAFERRIIHEFLSDATDLETESVGVGNTRRVVIKYVGESSI